VKRVAAISTFGAPRHIAFLAGDNGRNTIATAVRSAVFDPRCTCLFMGMYKMEESTQPQREEFLARVRQTIADEF
jgi:putative NADPH-quinone reductase